MRQLAVTGDRHSDNLEAETEHPDAILHPRVEGRLNASSREEQTKRPGWPGLKTATKEVAMTDNQELT